MSLPVRPSSIDDALERASQAVRAGRLDEAERLAFGVLKSNWGNVAAARLLGQAILLQDRPADAVEPLQRAARRTKDPMTETLLAKALLALGRDDEAFARLREAVSRRPAYPLAFLELGEQLSRAGRLAEAASVFEEGLALAPEAQVLQVGLAYNALRRHDRAAAKALFEAVRAAAPQRRDAMVGLGDTLARDGAWAAAAELYVQSLGLDPHDAETRLSLARCRLEQGDRAGGEVLLRDLGRAGGPLAGRALSALAATPHGRAFLKPSAALDWLGAAPDGAVTPGTASGTPQARGRPRPAAPAPVPSPLR